MNGKIIALIIVIIVAIVGVSAFLITQSPIDNPNGNETNGTNGTNNNVNINNKTNCTVSAVQSGPSSSQEGSTITLTWKVTNNGKADITNVQASSQEEDYDFGTIGPGETKTHTFTMRIPTTEELRIDFDENATVSNPFFIGGFGLSYSISGQEHTIQSNSIEIPLN